jgi:hypothetical protein
MTANTNDTMPDAFEPTGHDLLAGELTAALLPETLGAEDVLPPALAARITATGEALVRARTVPPIVTPIGAPGAAPTARRGARTTGSRTRIW